MWIARPLYELLPYIYMILGLALLGAAWIVEAHALPSVLMLIGALSLLGGLVLWLRRRDYRTRQAQYDARSLED